MYQIYTDKDIGRVEIRFDAVINRSLIGFDESLRLACLLTFRTAGYFDVLVDYTHSREMVGDVLQDARQRIEWCVNNGLRRSANITADPDLRRQIEDITAAFDHILVFSNRAEAVAWLDTATIVPLRPRP